CTTSGSSKPASSRISSSFAGSGGASPCWARQIASAGSPGIRSVSAYAMNVAATAVSTIAVISTATVRFTPGSALDDLFGQHKYVGGVRLVPLDGIAHRVDLQVRAQHDR